MIRYAAFDTTRPMLLSALHGVSTVTPSSAGCRSRSSLHTCAGCASPAGPPTHSRKFACPWVRSSHVKGDPFAIVISISLPPFAYARTRPQSEYLLTRTLVHGGCIGGV